MASYIEIQKLKDDQAKVRSLASYLLRRSDMDWTDWELDFLENMKARKEPMSTRQGEMLMELDSKAKRYTHIAGCPVKSLVGRCWIARLDLSENDEEFIDGLKQDGATEVSGNQARWLARCAKELNLIEGYVAIQ